VPHIIDTINELGGVAARRELLRRGQIPGWIDIFSERRRIDRVRKGWYATFDYPVRVRAAWRVGGRLACVSAANYLGMQLHDSGRLHVAVARGAAQLRKPTTHRERLSIGHQDEVVVHWTDTRSMEDLSAGERAAVGLATAFEQIAKCPAAAEAAAELWAMATADAARQRNR
jgi:hypothetical protein